MFRKILIANRGEIAVRVIRTCRKLGVATVAVHSDVDAGALHVALADEAVAIGGAQPAESYLRADRIVAAALDTGAEAIHPGYGFLSENPEFVEAVEAAGLVFIGPSASAIRAMGLKDAAKRLMAEAGVPVVPGYHGADQDPGHLEVEAAAVGYPVLIKAVAGGGGKGMRRVETPGRLHDGAGGGEGRGAGRLRQRRRADREIRGQAPPHRGAGLRRRRPRGPSLRAGLLAPAPPPEGDRGGARAGHDGRGARRDGRGGGARGGGDRLCGRGDGRVHRGREPGLRPDGFWFMEMNTRLQVEHPVTEAVTGVDLVEWQLRVASGEKLWVGQEDLPLRGHAFEARLYAEDVPKGFLPATGRLTHLAFPDGVRADSGVRAGDAISPFYDPMIAKIIVEGPTRAAALAKLRAALAGTEVAGSVTNLAFLRRLANHQGFAAGDVDTGLIGRDLDALAAEPEADSRVVALAALGALGLHEDGAREGFHLWTPLVRTVRMERGGEESRRG
jgi:3-methylcrotonyl-CoA carboxylase alpha subunit